MALPLVPIGLGALNLGLGAASYFSRRRRGQSAGQALVGAGAETAVGFAIPPAAKGALAVGGRIAGPILAGGAVDSAGDITKTLKGRMLQARITAGNALRPAISAASRAAKPVRDSLDGFLLKQVKTGGLGSEVIERASSVPPKYRPLAYGAGALLTLGAVGAAASNAKRGADLQARTAANPLKPAGSDQRRLESDVMGLRESTRFGSPPKSPDQQRLAIMLKEEEKARADLEYAQQQPGEAWEGGRGEPKGKGRGKGSGDRNAALRFQAETQAATARYQADSNAKTARYRADTALQGLVGKVNIGLRTARERNAADIQRQRIQTSGQKYQADQTLKGVGLRVQGDIQRQRIQTSGQKYQADQTLRGVGLRVQGDIQRQQIQTSGQKYQADQTLKGVGLRAQADIQRQQIQTSGQKYQADQTLKGVGLRAQADIQRQQIKNQADIQRQQIQTSGQKYQADQTLRGIESRGQTDIQRQRIQSSGQVLAAQARAASTAHAAALKKQDPEIQSINSLEELENYKRRKAMRSVLSDLRSL